MKKRNQLTLILLAILAVALFAACNDRKIEEANKFVDSANKKVDEAKGLVTRAADSFTSITKDLENFDEMKKARENEIKELVKNYDKVLELEKSAASDFVAAAKANSNEKFKAYYETSAKDVEKRAEIINQSKELAQALLNSKDLESYSKKLETIQAKSDSLTKEGDALREKLNKLEEEVKALNK